MAKTTANPSKRVSPAAPPREDSKAVKEKVVLTAKAFTEHLLRFSSAAELKKHHRFFDFDENDPHDPLQFAGVRMGQIFALADQYLDLPVNEIDKLLNSPVYEVRAGACSIMGKDAAGKKTSAGRKKELFDLYLKRHDRINHWGLVDLAAHKVIGRHLYESGTSRQVLYRLVRSADPSERRTAMVSTVFFIGKGDLDDAFKLAALLMKEKDELVQKAAGWALREAGKKDQLQLVEWLDQKAATMPRATLRNAIEHFDKKRREYYLGLSKIK